jgi:GxxExxY protein
MPGLRTVKHEMRECGQMIELGHKDLSVRVIEAAIAVHSALGPGFIESVYENALGVELAARGVSFEQQIVVPIHHRGIIVGEHRLDLLVEEVLLVELKAVKEIEDIFFAIGRSQMKAAGIRDGIILNFASMPLTIKRIGPGRQASEIDTCYTPHSFSGFPFLDFQSSTFASPLI